MPIENSSSEVLSRYQGCLIGAAVGDALGAPFEFLSAKEVRHKFLGQFEMVGGGFFDWRPGQTTDDTDQTLAIVDSLIESKAYNPADIARRFLQWYRSGPRDIGGTTSQSLRYLDLGYSYKESGRKTAELGRGTANGSLMRTAPIGLYFRGDELSLDVAAAEVSSITHASQDAIAACQMTSRLIADLATGIDREKAVINLINHYPSSGFHGIKLADALRGVNYQEENGYVFNTFSIALRAFLGTRSFEDAVSETIIVGGDTDTQATVAGALAGAHYGVDAIPERWKRALNPFTSTEIEEKAALIYQMNQAMV